MSTSFTHSVSLFRIEPERNCYRAYRLEVVPDLFGSWCVMRFWGRIGRKQRSMYEAFPTYEKAREQAEKLLHRRLGRGYSIRRVDRMVDVTPQGVRAG